MQQSKDNRTVVVKSKKLAAVLAALKMIVEYTGDYLSGNKYKFMSLNQKKQNVK